MGPKLLRPKVQAKYEDVAYVGSKDSAKTSITNISPFPKTSFSL